MPARPLCFVLLAPASPAQRPAGRVDLDAVWREVVEPAVEGAGLEAIRAVGDSPDGTVSKALHERLLLCDHAVVDVSDAGPDVFYAIGVRDALRPHATVLVSAGHSDSPARFAHGRVLTYEVGGDGRPVGAGEAQKALRSRLEEAMSGPPARREVSEMIDGPTASEIARLKTDLFRHRVRYPAEAKQRLAEARNDGIEAVRAIEADLGDPDRADTAVLIDLLLSYRALGTPEAWQAMVDLVERMPVPLRATTMVQEQLGLALGRLGRWEEAVSLLAAVVERSGPSSETWSILGRVYKDRWKDLLGQGDDDRAAACLDKAISVYLQGFEADWRDAYPGVNAVTLMEIRNPPDPRRIDLIPVVRYAATRRLASGSADYWDHATLLELAVIGRDEAAAREALTSLLEAVRERWEPQSTANNLGLLRRAREARGEADGWAGDIESALLAYGT